MNLPPHLQIETLRMSLGAILDAVDYNAGNCSQTQPVGSVLDRVLLRNAQKAMLDTRPNTDGITPPTP